MRERTVNHRHLLHQLRPERKVARTRVRILYADHADDDAASLIDQFTIWRSGYDRTAWQRAYSYGPGSRTYTCTTDDAMLYCCCRHSRSRNEAGCISSGRIPCDYRPPNPQHPLRKHDTIPVARGSASSAPLALGTGAGRGRAKGSKRMLTSGDAVKQAKEAELKHACSILVHHPAGGDHQTPIVVTGSS